MTPELLGFGLGAVRVLSYVGVVLLVGPLLFWSLVRPVGHRARWVVRLTALGLIGTAAATVIEPLLRVLAPFGVLPPLTPLAGAALLVRAAALVGWASFLPDLVAGPLQGVRRLMVWLVCVVVAASLAVQTNPPDSATTLIGAAVITLHVLAMTAWMGGLLTMGVVVVGEPGEDPDAEVGELGRLVPRYTTLSRWSLLVLAVTGVSQLLVESGGPALGSPRYGLLLLLKITLLTIMLVLGQQGRRFVARVLFRRRHADGTRTTRGLRTLRTVLGFELAAGGLVLAATAGLAVLGAP